MMNLKEILITMLKEDGYDTITACEIAYEKIKEIKKFSPGKYKIHSKKQYVKIIIKN